jgi:ATP-binding cassette subfamily B protein
MRALDLAWPLARAGEALQALASHSSLSPRAVEMPPAPAQLDDEAISRFIEGGAAWLGIEAEPFDVQHRDLEAALRRAAPALLLVRGDGEASPRLGTSSAPLADELSGPRSPRLLLLHAPGRLLGPDGETRPVDVEELRAVLARPLEEPLGGQIESLLDAARVPARRRPAARRALIAQSVGGRPVAGGWLLRESGAHRFVDVARRARVLRWAAALLGGHLGEYALYVASWALIGRGALDGRMDRGWLVAWALLLVASIPFRLVAVRAAGELGLRLGALLKARLLAGALSLEPEEIRHEGAGQLLGRVLESSAVETLAIGGGLTAAVATLELLVASGILAAGSAGWLGALALGGWLGALVLMTRAYARRRAQWTRRRLSLTHELVERMVGHRTRLVQEGEGRWHEGEDRALVRYVESARELDAATVWLSAWVPRGMLLVGLATLGSGFVDGRAPAAVALSLGGVLLAYRALRRLGAGLGDLVGAGIAWQGVAPLYRAAGRVAPAPAPMFALPPRQPAPGEPLVEADRIIFRHRDRGEPVLHNCSFVLRAGERILLEGPSGGGKSTLGTLVAGLRSPESGLLLLGGLDRHTLGLDGWRRRVVAAPQFHENHIFVGTLSFNLLFGRAWPPSYDDIREAHAVCEELGLGELLTRMPSGLEQMVGEIGWQLSHGERSRVYMARALLQRSDLVVLDESFAALDPETLRLAMECVFGRAKTLVVIAHP